MIKTFNITISDSLATLVERTQFEEDAKKAVITRILSDNSDSDLILESAAFKTYEKRFEEAHVKYETAKQTITDMYIPKDIQNSAKWSLDFNTKILTITADVDDNYEYVIPTED